MTPPEFPIPTTDLDAGGREFTFAVRPAWVRGVLEESGATTNGQEGALHVRASKSGRDVIIRGQLDVDLVTPCARCLDDVTIRLHHPITALLVPASDMRAGGGKGGEAELSAEDLDVIPYSGETISLDDLVRDELVLEIPIVPLCSEDCPGISPPPAKEDATGEAAIDPRLRPLFRLKKE